MKTVWKVLAGATALCLLWLALAGLLSPALMKKAPFGMSALLEKGHVGALFMGSSMYGKGIDPACLPEDSWVLAYNGEQPVQMAWMLEYLLGKGLSVDTLFVDLYLISLNAENPSIQDSRVFLDLTIPERLDLLKAVYQDRISLSLLREALFSGNSELLLTWPVYARVLSSRYSRGGRLDGGEGSTAEGLGEVNPYYCCDGMTAAQREALETIISLCTGHGIRLIFTETPKYRVLQQDPWYQLRMGEAIAWARAQGVEVIPAETLSDISTDPSCYEDLIHLSGKGRRAYSLWLMNQAGL